MSMFLTVVECAIEHNNHFLFIKRPPGGHAGGCLSFPGGKVEYADGANETNILIQAVKREIIEEVGLELIDPIHFVTSSFFVGSDNKNYLDIIFYCKMQQPNVHVTPDIREIPSHYWLTIDQIMAHHDCPPWLNRYMRMIEKIR
ncbi:MAG: NUDIX domain-containing protein [Chlamydiales bacterium]|nr:NUDIX domain-containing protein [Chlamydiales bacterium]